MPTTQWFLTSHARGNPSSRIDTRHPGDVAWTEGNLVRPLIHGTPYLGGVPLGRIDTPMIRDWRSNLLADGVSLSGAAKAYRLLRAVLMTAVKEDEIIRRNPCQIPGADQERPAERPTLTVSQVFELTAKVPDRYRALILLATFGCLRWGEVAALKRRDVDPVVGTVRVRAAFTKGQGDGARSP